MKNHPNDKFKLHVTYINNYTNEKYEILEMHILMKIFRDVLETLLFLKF